MRYVVISLFAALVSSLMAAAFIQVITPPSKPVSWWDRQTAAVSDFLGWTKQPVIAAGALTAGGITGGVVTSVAGMTAVGMMGSGTGIGAAAGPVGMVIGALTGLAIYGVSLAVADASASSEPKEQVHWYRFW